MYHGLRTGAPNNRCVLSITIMWFNIAAFVAAFVAGCVAAFVAGCVAGCVNRRGHAIVATCKYDQHFLSVSG